MTDEDSSRPSRPPLIRPTATWLAEQRAKHLAYEDRWTDDSEPGSRYLLVCLILLLVGGFADAGSYVLMGSFTGHVTGNALLTAIGIVAHRWSQALSCVLAVLAFLTGTAVGSVWPNAAKRSPCRRLVQPLAVEIVLIAFGALATTPHTPTGRNLFLVCLCLALGLQNGILSKVGSVSVHSTYITGMSTSLAASMMGGQPDPKRRLLPVVIGCFLAGALCGAFLASRAGLVGFAGILLPLALALLLAITAPRGGTNFDRAGDGRGTAGKSAVHSSQR